MEIKAMQGTLQEYEEWLKTRPDSVQQLAAEFSIASQFVLNGTILWLLGYTECDLLIVTPVDPSEDFEDAVARKLYLSAQRVRDGFAKH